MKFGRNKDKHDLPPARADSNKLLVRPPSMGGVGLPPPPPVGGTGIPRRQALAPDIDLTAAPTVAPAPPVAAATPVEPTRIDLTHPAPSIEPLPS